MILRLVLVLGPLVLVGTPGFAGTPPGVGITAADPPKVMSMRQAVKSALPATVRVEAERVRDKWPALQTKLTFDQRTRLATVMLPHLADASAYVRGEAAFWLGELGVVQHLAALEPRLANEDETDADSRAARVCLVKAIWKLKYAACITGPERVDLLIEAIQTQPGYVGEWAMTLACDSGLVACLPVFEKMANDPKHELILAPLKTAIARLAVREKWLLAETLEALKSEDRAWRQWALLQICQHRLRGALETVETRVTAFEKKYAAQVHSGPWPKYEEIEEFRLALSALAQLGRNRDDFARQMPISE